MTAIQITFPWGRYHAHPWGQNPTRLREAEWPPSPWRLLRALASAWFRNHPGTPPSADAIALLEILGRSLPEIGIGPVSFAQTVHWQPNYGAASADEKSDASYKNTRHENHFAAVSRPVLFRWPEISPTEVQRHLLASLLTGISYFGRAESLSHAALLADECRDFPDIGWCQPRYDSEKGKPTRQISAQCRDVFCSNPQDFKITDLWARRGANTRPDSPDAQAHLVDQLLASDMKADGALWVSYLMPSGWPAKWVVRVPHTEPAPRPPANQGPRIARYLRFSLQCRVPLQAKFTVPLAEQFRAAAHHHFSKIHGDGTSSFALFGHAVDRPPDAVGSHQHAFYLPMGHDTSQPGVITDLHIWCPYGFTQMETEILQRIHRLIWGNGRYPVRPILVAMSKDAPSDAPFSTGGMESRVWRSISPFVPPRYLYRGTRAQQKLRASESPENQLIKCLRDIGLTANATIRRLPGRNSTIMPAWDIVRAPEDDELSMEESESVAVHQNSSSGRMKHERRIGFYMEFEFVEKVALPMPSIGHSAHFGLGLFAPMTDAAE